MHPGARTKQLLRCGRLWLRRACKWLEGLKRNLWMASRQVTCCFTCPKSSLAPSWRHALQQLLRLRCPSSNCQGTYGCIEVHNIWTHLTVNKSNCTSSAMLLTISSFNILEPYFCNRIGMICATLFKGTNLELHFLLLPHWQSKA